MKRTTLICLCLVAALAVGSALAAGPISFRFDADHPDAVYRCGERALFSVAARDTNDVLVTSGQINLRLDNFGNTVLTNITVDLAKGNPVRLEGALPWPGFLRLKASGRDCTEAVYGVAFDPEKIRPTAADAPADFDAFWRTAKERYDREVPNDITLVRIAKGSNEKRDFYRMTLTSPNRHRLTGYLMVPADVSRGPFRALLDVPGAGPGWAGLWDQEEDTVNFHMNVHFFDYSRLEDVDDRQVYDKLRKELAEEERAERAKRYPTKSGGYTVQGIAVSREDYFYYDSILGISRAVDWIAAQKFVDKRRIHYLGASQGGGFGLILTGFNKNITKTVVHVPALTDLLPDGEHRRQTGWPWLVENQLPENREAARRNAPYFDALNFARRITVPIRLSVGFCDTCCAPHAGYAAYNVIPSKDKGMFNDVGSPHSGSKTVYRRAREWLAGDKARSTASLVLKAGDVQVAVASEAVPVARFAAEELTNYLSRVLGGAVPLVRTIDGTKKTIVVGDCAWSRAEGIDVSSFARDGFVCKAVGDRVYLAGRDDASVDPARFIATGSGDIYYRKSGTIYFERATLFAAYDFLERIADVRFFFPGELGTVVPRKDTLEVALGEHRAAPVFTERYYSSHRATGKWYDTSMDARRMHRLNNLRLRYGTQRIPCCHGQRHFHYVPRFAKTHPEYFCLQKNGERYLIDTGTTPHYRNGKLCYSSAVMEEMYQDVKAYLTGKPASSRGLGAWGGNCVDGRYVDIMCEDSMMECHCAKCQAEYNKAEPMYATDFIWRLTAEIARRLTAEGVKGDVTQMAYPPYRRVPGISLPDNVQVMVAEAGPWSVANPQAVASQVKEIRAWSEKLGHRVWLWTYPGKYGNRLPDIPQISPRAYAKFFREAEPWIMGGYIEIETDRYLYDALNVYMYSRLSWDPYLDVEALIEDWHGRLFGAAARPMQAAFDLLERLWVYGVSGGRMIDTPLGPEMSTPTTGELWTKIYSPEAIARLEGLFAAAARVVSPESREGKCVALMRDEILEPLVRRAKKVSVKDELARRAKRGVRSVLTNGELDTLDGWVSAINDAKVTADTANRVTGAASAKLVTSATDFGNNDRYTRADLAQSVKLEKGRTYRLSYFVKTENVVRYNRSEGAGLCLWLADGKYLKNPLPLIAGSCDWMHQEMTFTAEKHMTARLQFRVTQALGTMWIDGVVLEPID